MASIIKNQILKHLSKFTKNLSPDKINLSTLKGEGELSNLELDETILMDLLELPTWMKLIKAMCNKVSIKIQWTKLKSQPICLYLDEVILEIETCEEPRPPNSPSQQSSYRSEGKYGFVDKVIDGIYVHINAVSVKFISQKFLATLQLSRVVVQSTTPTWYSPTDLRQTRIRDTERGEILLFKEVDWQTTRIEANAREDDDSIPSTPLRLIANQSKIRITLKKRLSDCSIIASRVILLLDDLLWVLTDTQLKAAILYANSLRQMIEKSTAQSKKLAAEKLQKQGHIGGSPVEQVPAQQKQQQRARSQSNESKLFSKFDVATTSYHLITCRIDLHLCDDTPPDREVSPKHNKQIDGGAMQIVLCKLSVDFYPFHPAGGERKQWYRYTDNQGSRNHWVQQLFKAFKEEVTKARETCSVASPSQSPAHIPVSQKSPSRHEFTGKAPTPQRSPQPVVRGQITSQAPVRPRVTKLLESCMVLRIEEFIIYRVSTADNKRSSPQKFFCSDKKALHLPSDMSMIHIEYTDYFFTEGIDYPVPHANLYVLVNPVRLTLDFLTLLWANYFSLNLAQTVESQIKSGPEAQTEHVDVKIEAVMPRFVIPSDNKVEDQPDRPESMQLQMSKLTATNTHVEDGFLLSDLHDILDQYLASHLYTSREFPNEGNNMAAFPPHFMKMALGMVNPYMNPYAQQLVQGQIPHEFIQENVGIDFVKKLLHVNTLKRDARFDLWAVKVDQLWLEFLGVPTSKTRPFPFLESLPLSLWSCQPYLFPDLDECAVSPENLTSTLAPRSYQELLNGQTGLVQSEAEKLQLQKMHHSGSSRPSKKRLKEYYSSQEDDSESLSASSADDIKSESCDSSVSQGGGNVQCVSCQFAGTNILAKIGSKVRAQLNHYQYLFIMRLLESVTNFQDQMKADLETFLGAELHKSGGGDSFSIPIVVPEFEFAVVCPYIAELLPLTDNSGAFCSPITESSDGHESYLDTDTDLNVEKSESSSGKEEDQVLTVIQTDEGPLVEMTDSLHPESHIIKSQSDSRIVCHLPGTQNPEHTLVSEKVRRDSHSTEELTSQQSDLSPLDILGQNPHLNVSDSGLGSIGSNSQRSRSHSKVTNQVKKSFTSAMTNILPEKFKNRLDLDEDDSDRLSIRTDMSDDDDFEMLSLDDTEVPAFNRNINIETASSTGTDIQDDLSSVFADTTSASKAKELVSVVVFRLTNAELLLQGTGADTIVRIQAQKLETEETGNIIYEDFYSKLSNPKGYIREAAKISGSRFPVRFKYVSGPTASKLAGSGTEEVFMDIKVLCDDLSLKMSSITNLANFVEDEKIGTPAPMHVDIQGVHLTLQEDRPPSVTSSGNMPVNLDIQNLAVQRYQDGVFHLTSNKTGISSTPMSRQLPEYSTTGIPESVVKQDGLNLPPSTHQELSHQNQQLQILLEKLDRHIQEQEVELEQVPRLKQENDSLKAENDALRQKLMCFGKAEMSTGIERKKLEEDNRTLIEKLVSQQDELQNLKDEKTSLVTTLHLMQEELLASEQRYKRAVSNKSS